MHEFKPCRLPPLSKLSFVGLALILIFFILLVWAQPVLIPFFLLVTLSTVGRPLALYVRSYRVTDDWIIIHRYLWDIPLPRKQLLSAALNPAIFDNSDWSMNTPFRWMYCGNFRSWRHGPFRAFVSDPMHAVMLHFHDEIVIVSPEDVRAFIAALKVPLEVGWTPPPSHAAIGGYFSGYW